MRIGNLLKNYLNNEANAKSHTHCQVAHSQPHKPKLVNKYVFANAEKNANKIKRNRKNEESPAPNKGYA